MSEYDEWVQGGVCIRCRICGTEYRSLFECPGCVRVEQEREQVNAEEDSSRVVCSGTSDDTDVLT